MWANTNIDDQGDGREAPEPGTYDITLDDARAFTSKAGRDVVILDMRVVSGEAMGHRWTEMRGFKTEGQTKAAKATCARLGVPIDEVANLQELDAELKRLVGGYFEVEIVQNGEWRNVYVQGRATPGDLPATPTPTPAADVPDDDVPF